MDTVVDAGLRRPASRRPGAKKSTHQERHEHTRAEGGVNAGFGTMTRKWARGYRRNAPGGCAGDEENTDLREKRHAGLRREMGLASGSDCVSQALTRIPLVSRSAEAQLAAVVGAGLHRPASRQRGAKESMHQERGESVSKLGEVNAGFGTMKR
ncbi:hypothetical protein Ssi03_05750 [Sphaerisporangium siamense]|nr:hypothetical protein Ssi03_05750 [Sphaerisporangium siamense]